MAHLTKKKELLSELEKPAFPPAIGITDSHAFGKVSADTFSDTYLTSFFILFARQKSDLCERLRGGRRLESLAPGIKSQLPRAVSITARRMLSAG